MTWRIKFKEWSKKLALSVPLNCKLCMILKETFSIKLLSLSLDTKCWVVAINGLNNAMSVYQRKNGRSKFQLISWRRSNNESACLSDFSNATAFYGSALETPNGGVGIPKAHRRTVSRLENLRVYAVACDLSSV